MTTKEWAAKLNGREYPFSQQISKEEIAAAKAEGIVIVYGASDDLMELEGAIRDEVGAHEGGTACILGGKLLEPHDADRCDCPYCGYAEAEQRAKVIKALWCPENVPGNPSWAYKTDIPHETFDIMEDGELYCRGIVFRIEDV